MALNVLLQLKNGFFQPDSSRSQEERRNQRMGGEKNILFYRFIDTYTFSFGNHHGIFMPIFQAFLLTFYHIMTALLIYSCRKMSLIACILFFSLSSFILIVLCFKTCLGVSLDLETHTLFCFLGKNRRVVFSYHSFLFSNHVVGWIIRHKCRASR